MEERSRQALKKCERLLDHCRREKQQVTHELNEVRKQQTQKERQTEEARQAKTDQREAEAQQTIKHLQEEIRRLQDQNVVTRQRCEEDVKRHFFTGWTNFDGYQVLNYWERLQDEWTKYEAQKKTEEARYGKKMALTPLEIATGSFVGVFDLMLKREKVTPIFPPIDGRPFTITLAEFRKEGQTSGRSRYEFNDPWKLGETFRVVKRSTRGWAYRGQTIGGAQVYTEETDKPERNINSRSSLR